MIRAVVVAAFLIATVASQQVPWHITHVGDTQHYTTHAHRMPVLEYALLAIVYDDPLYVAQVGDLVQNGANSGDPIEWQRILGPRAFGLLTAHGVPWGSAPGNHDLTRGRHEPGEFDAWRLHMRNTPSPEPNSWRIIQTPQGPIGVVHAEFEPTDRALGQIVGWLEAHPTLPVIWSTHSHAWPGHSGNIRVQCCSDLSGGGVNAAEVVYHKVLEPYPQVFLTLSGHGRGEGVSANEGHPNPHSGVHLIDSHHNHQGDPYGGNGYYRQIGFAMNHIWFRDLSWAHAPLPNRDMTTYRHLPLPRLRQWLSTVTVHHIRNGADTFIWEWGGVHGQDDYMRCHDWHGGLRAQGLLRFDLSGLRPGSRVDSAVLTVTIEGPVQPSSADGFALHALLSPWSERDSFGDVFGGDGVDLGGNGADALAQPDATRTSAGKTMTIDVTDRVRAWVDGTLPNWGWVIAAGGPDNLQVRTFDWWALTERPLLTVVVR